MQVAKDRTSTNGRVIGIDIIPAQPPKGVSTLQGNFLSPAVQEELKKFIRDTSHGRTKQDRSILGGSGQDEMTEEDLAEDSLGYLEREKRLGSYIGVQEDKDEDSEAEDQDEEKKGRTVDVVLSDMSEPWAQTDGFWKRSLSNPYYRMMNTSGNPFRDHVGSMVRMMLFPESTSRCSRRV